MSRIKELAREIRMNACRHRDRNGDRWDYYEVERTNKLLDLIDGAEEHQLAPLCSSGREGMWLFFPDPQPTLKDAAQAVVEERMAALRSNSILDKRIDNLAAALKRED